MVLSNFKTNLFTKHVFFQQKTAYKIFIILCCKFKKFNELKIFFCNMKDKDHYLFLTNQKSGKSSSNIQQKMYSFNFRWITDLRANALIISFKVEKRFKIINDFKFDQKFWLKIIFFQFLHKIWKFKNSHKQKKIHN